MVYYGVSIYHSGWLGDVLELFGSKMLETAESNLGWQCLFCSLLTHQASVLMTSTFVFPDLKCEPKVEVQEETVSARAGGNWAVFLCHQDLRGIHTYIKDVWWSTTVLYFKLVLNACSSVLHSAHDLLWRLLDLNLAWRREARGTKLLIFLRDETVRGHVQKLVLSILLVLGNVSPWQPSQHV